VGFVVVRRVPGESGGESLEQVDEKGTKQTKGDSRKCVETMRRSSRDPERSDEASAAMSEPTKVGRKVSRFTRRKRSLASQAWLDYSKKLREGTSLRRLQEYSEARWYRRARKKSLASQARLGLADRSDRFAMGSPRRSHTLVTSARKLASVLAMRLPRVSLVNSPILHPRGIRKRQQIAEPISFLPEQPLLRFRPLRREWKSGSDVADIELRAELGRFSSETPWSAWNASNSLPKPAYLRQDLIYDMKLFKLSRCIFPGNSQQDLTASGVLGYNSRVSEFRSSF
jgi:hypothetical protein